MLLPDPEVRGAMARLGSRLMDALRDAGTDVVPCRWGRHADAETGIASAGSRFCDLLRILRLLRDNEFDVLFVNTAHDRRALLRDVPLLIATRGLARVRVLQFHGSLSNELSLSGRPLLKAASRWLARDTDAVLMLSSEEVEQWRAFEPDAFYHAVTNPYVRDPALAASLEERSAGRFDAPPVILFVGRLLAAKGIFDLVDAVARIRGRVDCRLRFAGDGRDEEPLRRRVHAAGLDGDTRLLGHLTSTDLIREYRQATVFALPSYSEGFATVLAEAMDAGLPIVATGIRGAADHLTDGDNALLVPPGRVDLLADALYRVLTDAELRTRMGTANRTKVGEFAPSVVAQEYRRLFEAVLGHDARGARTA